MDLIENILMVIIPSLPIGKNKSLRKNHACTFCSLYGHYYHHYQDLGEFRASLRNLQKNSLESEIMVIKEIHVVLTLVQPIAVESHPPPSPQKPTTAPTPAPPHPKRAKGRNAKATSEPRQIPPCAIYEEQGHPTQN